MAVIPSDRSWALRSVEQGHVSRIVSFLESDPLLNVYLISKLTDEGVSGPGETVEVSAAGRTVLVASLGSNVVLAADPESDSFRRDTGVRMLAQRILARRIGVRAAISDAGLVELLWKYLGPHLEPPTVVRLRQPIYALPPSGGPLPSLGRMRYATLADLDLLVPCCAAMHREEVGIDPLERDAVGYRERIRDLVQKKRSLLMVENGTIAFKCELSAITPAAVQLMGVWTHPSYRRRGLARQGMNEICGEIGRGGRAVTLFVNDFNQPAITLYESLGFRQIGMNRALIW